jgi:alkylhydroperoxidase/carboxymuconolactone decarboxylase family protein YurZ
MDYIVKLAKFLAAAYATWTAAMKAWQLAAELFA